MFIKQIKTNLKKFSKNAEKIFENYKIFRQKIAQKIKKTISKQNVL